MTRPDAPPSARPRPETPPSVHPHPDTLAVHPPHVEVTGSRPLGVPLHQGHVFAFDSADALAEGFTSPDAFLYARLGNPTVRTLEDAVARLEGGASGLSFASGMGAVNAVLLSLLGSGAHVVAQTCLYGGTYAVLTDLAARWGVHVTYVSGTDPEEVRAALRPETRLLYLETIANPTTRVSDLPALAAVAAEAGVPVAVDNTFASPLLCRPLDHGADVVIHSATKYLAGHADVLGGVAVFKDRELYGRVRRHAVEQGASTDPFAAWLTLRGLQTLSLRVERQCANAAELAARLAAHPAVAAARHPSLASHPDREVAARLLPAGGGGVVSIDLAGGRDAGRTFVEAVRLASLSVSLGDVKTLVMHPASTSHHQLDAAALAAAGIGAGTVRISVGIEHVEDLWTDLEQALDQVLKKAA
ncbi:methionine gamma-lyase [Streptomyces cinereoruber]|uniref:homocysteine desulfhydrase n=1 Tax=Streptomyces cinereoruber TaxID=67260 RepID=A0AAV4KKZ1_9ACTN|nr:aminotransferase class I/II-fold pyridoxal phosphate-dependent enzyme [Streptomyces cinereoruber]MBB4159840.1 methionine-gamma-lyase [Streptomyces cinereoruber]MBY8817793.1 aminotransferase class I/II-fold pyridoxal phosphate-dependent enzyme [Streptomyces cinereoruber]NIH60548.1 methionine-gamma-lyase [Streptomyces cinereoruber]QEV33681.1 aminotransferase class I/II-fold pyridoxal phosphate-dependent enzyme [Streptomyces cinereoruber]GGR32308.1 methionine gamma-lyase [Streptomyces cinereor